MSDGTDQIVLPRKKRIFERIAVVRLLLFFFLLALVYAGGQVLLTQIAHRISTDIALAVSIGGTVLVSTLAISVYALLVGWLERRDITELALLRGIPLLIGGILLAFLMFCGVYAVLWSLHAATWLGIAGYAGVAPFIAMAVLSGIGEELIFRGGVFRIMEDMFGTTIALIVSGALFGALHMMNPHATWVSGLAIALEAGVLLAAAYAASRSLWLPIGLHIGWNFTEGGVFGAAVSGSGGGQGIVNMPVHGPALLTGGSFGPEASVVTVMICLAVAFYFLMQTKRRGRWVRASFHMMLD